MKYVGAGTPSADRITLLRGVGTNGLAQTRSIFLKGLHSPFGMALVGANFYVANTNAVLRFPYTSGDTQITAPASRCSTFQRTRRVTGRGICSQAATARGSM